jgi:putative ABC transport system substrate-binding protein
VQECVARLGVQPLIIRANAESDFKTAFSTIIQQQVGALLVCASPFFNTRRQLLVLMAARQSLPAIYEWRLCRGGRSDELRDCPCRRLSSDRHLCQSDSERRKTHRPARCTGHQIRACHQLATAKALDLQVSPTLLARADEVIE